MKNRHNFPKQRKHFMKLILKFLKPHWKLCLLTVLFSAVDVVSALLIPTYAGEMLNEGTQAGVTFDAVALTSVKMAVVAVLSAGGALIGAYCCSLLTSRVGADMRKALYKKSLDLSVADFKEFGTASMTTRSVSDVANIQFALLNILQMMLPVPFVFVTSLVLTFRIDWLMGVILCVILAVISVVATFIMHSAAPCFRKLQKHLDKMSTVLLENITGVRVVRAFNKEKFEENRLGKSFENYRSTSVKANLMFASLDCISFFMVNVFVLVVYWLSGWRISAGAYESGDIVSVIEYALMSLFFLMMAQMVILTLPRAMECCNRLDEVLRYTPQITDIVTEPVELPRTEDILSFRNVGFRYADSEKAALSHLDFCCKRGETTAIIGGTGSGKSTVASLMMRFNEATEGEILFCDCPIKLMPQQQLRDKLAYVQQRAWLFSGTIAENLRYGNQNASDEELWHALEVAQAATFVKSLPDGLNSFVAQGGTNFSGGQKQRLSIARALVKKAELYVFDDSFSALDFKTDAALRRALASETKNSAVIIVAQRVSSIQHANQIIVLNDGEIVGKGTHGQLLDNCPTYTKRQTAENRLLKAEKNTSKKLFFQMKYGAAVLPLLAEMRAKFRIKGNYETKNFFVKIRETIVFAT